MNRRFYNGRDAEIVLDRHTSRFDCYVVRWPGAGEWPDKEYTGPITALVEEGFHGVGCGQIRDPKNYHEITLAWRRGVRALLAW